MDLSKIASCSIFPTIGVARVGNSQTEYFIGPEVPGIIPEPRNGKYKDGQGRIKRQAGRFRIYAYDEAGEVLGELTNADAPIHWTVELANTKAAFNEFSSRFDASPRKQRNPDVPQSQRDQLRITPGPRTITGTMKGPVKFDTGRYKTTPVPLGELRTDDAGRLLVLGGFGLSHSPSGVQIKHYANNNDWHDDVSDGPVSASIDLGGGRTISAAHAHVIVAPPDFAPGITSIVTLWDMQYGTAIRAGWLQPPTRCNFPEHILPLFERAVGYTWVNGFALNGHGVRYRGDFLASDMLKALRDPSQSSRVLRESVFARFRDPDADEATRSEQADEYHMPQLWGDGGQPQPGRSGQGNYQLWLTVTSTQYRLLRAWVQGDFVDDAIEQPKSLEAFATAHQPQALTRAALEACVGGAFYPGIEMTYIARDPETFSAPFQLSEKFLKPGSVTQWMACPWQADFFECQGQWWPAQRPDDVVTQEIYEAAVREYDGSKPDITFEAMIMGRERWDRGVVDNNNYAGDNQFVHSWNEMGFVVKTKSPEHTAVYIETERDVYAGYNEREYFYRLLNIDQFPDFLPKARFVVEQFLKQTRAYMASEKCQAQHEPFIYTPEAFESRLQTIYIGLEQDRIAADPTTDSDFHTRDDLIFRQTEMAPFNQLDGAWLRNITQAGPTDEVAARIFAIWRDEVGDGDPALNHCNLYTDQLHSIGVYPPENIRSRDYAYWPTFLDEAFTQPLFQLAISQFSEDYYAELLGMTLFLEWEVLGLWPTLLLLRYFNIDAHFYEMHIGIDNAANGHGAKAKEAAEIYLDAIMAKDGPEARERAWQRVWLGYVAFATIGSLGQAISDELARRHKRQADDKEALEAALSDLINQKMPFGQHNHGDKRLGDNLINDLFKDPAAFLDALVQSGMIIPGDPEDSPFFQRTSFDGPMYKVFTDEELLLWRRWISAKKAPAEPSGNDYILVEQAISHLKRRQEGEPMHAVIKIAAPGGELRSIAQWLESSDTLEFLRALRDPENGLILPGNTAQSPFLAERLSMDTPMGRAWAEVAPNSGGRTWQQIMAKWIKDGCPLPEKDALKGLSADELHAAISLRRIRLMPLHTEATTRELLPRPHPKLLGNPAVH